MRTNILVTEKYYCSNYDCQFILPKLIKITNSYDTKFLCRHMLVTENSEDFSTVTMYNLLLIEYS